MSDKSIVRSGDSHLAGKKPPAKAIVKKHQPKTRSVATKKRGQSNLDLQLKEAELQKTLAETKQISVGIVQSGAILVKTLSEIHLIEAQALKTEAETYKTIAETQNTAADTDKIIVEKDKLKEDIRSQRRWPLVFAVTALTAVAALAGVSVQYLHYRNESDRRTLQIEQDKAKNEGDRVNLEQQQLELFKQQNPEMTKLYEMIGGLNEKHRVDQATIKALQNDKLKNSSQKPNSQKPDAKTAGPANH